MPVRDVLRRLLVVLALAWGGAIAQETASVGLPGADDGYTLMAGDLLEIQVYDHPELSRKVRITSEGILPFPLIGRVEGVIGRRDSDLAAEIGRRLEDGFLRMASVTVTPLEFAPRRAFVLGSVQQPGAIDLPPFGSMGVTQGITQRGGFTEDANQRGVRVVRASSDASRPSEVLDVPGGDRLAAGDRDLELRPGDVVLVPRLDRVFIFGKVTRPGAVPMPSQERLTLSKAIGLAGGFERFARQSDVQLLRAGQPVRRVDVDALLSGKGGDDPVLQAGDTVYVPESRF